MLLLIVPLAGSSTRHGSCEPTSPAYVADRAQKDAAPVQYVSASATCGPVDACMCNAATDSAISIEASSSCCVVCQAVDFTCGSPNAAACSCTCTWGCAVLCYAGWCCPCVRSTCQKGYASHKRRQKQLRQRPGTSGQCCARTRNVPCSSCMNSDQLPAGPVTTEHHSSDLK